MSAIHVEPVKTLVDRSAVKLGCGCIAIVTSCLELEIAVHYASELQQLVVRGYKRKRPACQNDYYLSTRLLAIK